MRGRRHFLRTGLAGLVALSVLGLRSALPRMAHADDPGGPAAAPDEPPLPADDSDETEEVEEVEEEPAVTYDPGIPPITLAIPKLGVEARVVGVAQDEEGAMDVPPDPDQVAWYTLGPGMGVPGNAVFAAHIDWGGIPRAFGRLSALAVGDVVLIVDERHNGYEYVVESTHWVRAEGAPVEEIFAQTTDPTITLITCGGEYRAATREYLDRLIVHARGTL
jgi:sortase (surface protein transpeptidase)